jgi:DNA-binding NarL/FixJ family response regulator
MPPYIDVVVTAFKEGVTESRAPSHVAVLTSRELEVLNHIAAGESNQEIARHLVVTLPTVKRHVSNIFDKLAVTSRTQAVARARQRGVL